MEDKDLDRLFRDTFIDAEENPREGIWQKIEHKLEEQPKVVGISTKKNWLSLSAAAILLFTLGYWGITKNYKKNTLEVSEKEVLLSNVDIVQDKIAPQHSNTVPQKDERIKLEKQTLDKKIQLATIKKTTTKQTIVYNREINTIEGVEEIKPTQLTAHKPTTELPLVRQVTEIDDIQPLIEPEEEMETMLASTSPKAKESRNIITTVLNTISENIDTKSAPEVRFYADEEGSFGINIINSIAKNRNKKRK